MHPAPSLVEAPPKTDESRSPGAPPSGPVGVQQSPPTPSHSVSPPLRKDTNSSISTQATTATAASGTTSLSVDSNNTSYSAESPPKLHHTVFNVKDGTDVSNNRRPSRRRTGPLSQQQREKAALIRKLGACNDCRRRRVACHPSHHNLTWEDAMRKFRRSHSPSLQELIPLAGGRPLSPAPALVSEPVPNNDAAINHDANNGTTNHVKIPYKPDPHEMDIDLPPSAHQPGRLPLSEARIRTPLPSGPRLDKTTTLPGIDSLKTDLQNNVSKILASPHRGRYSAVNCLLLLWRDEDYPQVESAVRDLAEVLETHYRYTFQYEVIPTSPDVCQSPGKWLSRTISDFADDRDNRDVLKIVYYNGHSYLDANRDMVLASSRDRDHASIIPWSRIQPIFEEARADMLILMDAAYYPSSKMVRNKGVLEVIAASTSDDHSQVYDRCLFTRTLTEELRARATQGFTNPLSAVELHSKLVSSYPKLIRDRSPDRERVRSLPAPLHMQISNNSRLASIQLAPLQRTGLPFGPDPSAPQVHLQIRLTDEPMDVDSWTEWLRMMPDGVKDVKVEGPFRPYR